MTWSPENVVRAWRVAAKAHQGQTLPGSDLPYLLHLAQVMTEVAAAKTPNCPSCAPSSMTS